MAAPSPSGSSMGPFIPDDDDDDDIDLCFSSTESQSSSSGGGNHSGSSSATTNTKAQSRKKLAKAQPSSISGAAAAAAASGSKVRPCGPCRMRRVKCDRTPGTDETVDCVKCSLKGIVCTPMPPRAKRKQVNRSGPLISAAKAVYGEAGAPKDSSSSSETSPTHVPPQPASAVAVRLNTSELRGSLIASLLDFYLEFLKENVGFFMELNIQAKFEAAGRQLCHLDDQSQVLMAAMAATAARTSDHPLIVGVCPIRVPDIPKTSFIGTDLSEYGRRRVAACSSLTEYAISLADEKKTLRVASLESISALMLLEGLVDSWDNDDVGTGTGTGLAKKSRSPWTTSYLGHARRFVETIQPVSSPEWDNGPVSRSIIVWTAFLREAVVSGKVGRASMFTEDDLELMWGSYRPCSVQQMINSVPAGYDAERAFGELFDSWMASLIKVALNITPRLTGLKARRQTEADLQFLCETMETLDLAQRATPVLAERGLAREQARERGECQWKEPFGCPNGNFFFGKNFRSLQLVRCTQCFLIHDIVTQRVAELKALLESKPQSVNPDYAPRLLAVREQTHFRAVAAAREVSSILRNLLFKGMAAGGEWTDPKSLELLFGGMKEWVPLLINHPTTEEGGTDISFSYDVKLSELEWILKSAWSVSWSYEHVGRNTPWLEQEVQKIRDKRDAFWLTVHVPFTATSGLLSAPSPVTTLSDTLSDSTAPNPFAVSSTLPELAQLEQGLDLNGSIAWGPFGTFPKQHLVPPGSVSVQSGGVPPSAFVGLGDDVTALEVNALLEQLEAGAFGYVQ